MPTIRVSTRAQLDAALKGAKGGETILLAAGNYGELVTGRDFASPVTLRSEKTLGAKFDRIELSGATGLSFEKVAVKTGFSIERGSSDISVSKVDVNGTLYLRNASDILIEDSRIHDGNYGVLLNSVQNFTVRGNDISGAKIDLMRVTGNSYNGVIEDNFIHDPKASRSAHPDCIQFFGSNSPGTKYTPHDIVVRGNHLYALSGEDSSGAQGIFISDPRGASQFRNLLIEDNLIQVQFTNALYIAGGEENVVVRNNTLLPNRADGSAFIRLASKNGWDNSGVVVEGNVVKMIIDETKNSVVGDNYAYGRWADLDALFQGGGEGDDWSDFVPVKGSPIDFGSGYGAEDLLARLLGLDLRNEAGSGTSVSHNKAAKLFMAEASPEAALEGLPKELLESGEGAVEITFDADAVSWRHVRDVASWVGYSLAWTKDGAADEDGQAAVLVALASDEARDLDLIFDDAAGGSRLYGEAVGQGHVGLGLVPLA